MCPALYPFPNYALGVSCGVFSTSLKLRPENHDDLLQTKCRPGAPIRLPSTSLHVAYRPEIFRFSGKNLSLRVLPCTATSRGGFGVHRGVLAIGLGQYPFEERLNANLERITDSTGNTARQGPQDLRFRRTLSEGLDLRRVFTISRYRDAIFDVSGVAPIPQLRPGVSCGVFPTSLKSRPHIYDELSQTQCRPGGGTVMGYKQGYLISRRSDDSETFNCLNRSFDSDPRRCLCWGT